MVLGNRAHHFAAGVKQRAVDSPASGLVGRILLRARAADRMLSLGAGSIPPQSPFWLKTRLTTSLA